MAKTKEEIRDLLMKIQELPHFDVMANGLDDLICGELEIKSKKLVQAIIDDDIDGVIAAFTGWDVEGLLFGEFSPLYRFSRAPLPPKEGAPVHTPPTDGHWHEEDYTWEYCPECDTEQVIYSKGVTACPNCGEPLAPCSCCEDGCDYTSCPYGCTGDDEDSYKAVTNPPISKEEQKWYAEQSAISPCCPVPDHSGNDAKEDFSFDNSEQADESDDPTVRICGADGTPICDCPYWENDWAWSCPSGAHGICLEGSPCNGPINSNDEENDSKGEPESSETLNNSSGEPLKNPAVLNDPDHLFQCVSDNHYNFHVMAIDLVDALTTAITWYQKQFPNSKIMSCFRVTCYVAECQDPSAILVSDAYKNQFPEVISEGEEDDGEFECCYDCSQCEINGFCERQEHLNEVDNEVDAL